jgi:protoporphyrinogen oxidase
MASIKNLKASLVFVGGGIPSLILAFAMTKFHKLPICIIEKSPEVGGQYKSLKYENGLVFDQGMHIYYETGIKELDSVLLQIIPDRDWHFLEDNEKDIAGIFYNGKLQTNSPYPDLRNFSLKDKNNFIASIFENINNININGNAGELLRNHFGNHLAEEIFKPILQNLYGTHYDNLSSIVFRLTAINRVVLYDANVTLDLMSSIYLKNRIAYPDQMNLPIKRTNISRGLYPRKFGFGGVIEILRRKLEERGAIFLMNTEVLGIKSSNNVINSLVIRTENEDEYELRVATGVLWASDIYSLLRNFNVKLKYNMDFGHKKFVNLLTRHKPKMGNLYYFYNFDSVSKIFRVTNYSEYCPRALYDGYYPICIEYWSENESNEDIITRVILDLVKIGIIEDKSEVIFADVPEYKAIFPKPLVETVSSIEEASNKLIDLKINNLVHIGSYSKPNVFFLHEILKDAFVQVKNKGWI